MQDHSNCVKRFLSNEQSASASPHLSPGTLSSCSNFIHSHYRGRGAFESMGAGIAMSPGDIAFKCNFATLDTKSGIVTSRRADRR